MSSEIGENADPNVAVINGVGYYKYDISSDLNYDRAVGPWFNNPELECNKC
jgi:hypothetical protein